MLTNWPKKISLLLIFWAAISSIGQASHIKGVDCYWDYLGLTPAGNHRYRIFIRLFSDCSGGGFAGIAFGDIGATSIQPAPGCGINPMALIPWTSAPVQIPSTSPPQFYPPGLSAQDVTPYCRPDIPNTCDNPGSPGPAGTLPGVSGFVWYRDYDFPPNACNEYIIRFNQCCRNNLIQMINNTSGDNLCIESRMFFPQIGNSSPRYSSDVSPFVYQGVYKTFNMGPFDPDGDAFAFSMGPIFESGGAGCMAYPNPAYTPGLSQTTPLPSTVTFVVTPSGTVSFLPPLTAALGDYGMGMVLTEQQLVNGVMQTTAICRREVVFTIVGPATVLGSTGPGITVNPAQPFMDSAWVQVESPTLGTTQQTFPQAWQSGQIIIECAPGDEILARFFGNDTGNVIYNIGGVITIDIDSLKMKADLPPNMPGATFNAPNIKLPPLVMGQFQWVPTTPGIYDFIITMEDDLCPLALENTQEVRIIVCAPPNPLPPTLTVACNQVTFSIDPAMVGVNQWYFSGPELDNNPQNANVPTFAQNYTAPGTYPFEIRYQPGQTGGAGCPFIYNGTVTIIDGVTMQDGAGFNTTTCSGVPAELGSPSVAGQTYVWTMINMSPAVGLDSSNIANPTATLTHPGGPVPVTLNYLVTATAPNGCQFQDSVSVTVIPIPTVNVVPASASACVGDEVIIVASATDPAGTPIPPGSFSWSTGQAPTLDRDTVAIAQPINQSVSVAVSDITGCLSAPVTVVINVTAPPVASVGGDTVVCLGQGTNIVALGGFDNYVWSTGAVGNSLSLTATQLSGTTNYTLQAVENGCPGPVVPFNITINTPPTVSFTTNVPNNVFCEGAQSVNFTYTGSPIDAGSANWLFGDGALPGVSTAQSPQGVEYLTPGVKTITLVAARNGCSATTTQQITVIPEPTAFFEIRDNKICFNENGNGNQGFIINNRSSLSDPNQTGGLPVNYLWEYMPDGQFSTGDQLGLHTINFASPGTKTIRLTMSIGGCTDTQQENVTVDPVPPTPTVLNDSLCRGYLATVAVLAPIQSGSTNIYWYNSPANAPSDRDEYFHTGQSYTHPDRLEGTTTWYVRSFDVSDGCYSDLAVVRGVVFPNPQLSINANATELEIPNAILSLEPVAVNLGLISDYHWDFGDGFTTSVEAPVHQYLEPGTYNVTVAFTDINGCSGAGGPKKISVFEKIYVQVPTAFVPGSGGENGTLQIFDRLVVPEGFDFRVYDRFGIEIFKTNDIRFQWNGDVQGGAGGPAPEGVYPYVLKAKAYNGRDIEQTGTITIVR